MEVRHQNLCEEFRRNPTVNPFTGRAIVIGSPTYTRLVRECGEPIQGPQLGAAPTLPVPPVQQPLVVPTLRAPPIPVVRPPPEVPTLRVPVIQQRVVVPTVPTVPISPRLLRRPDIEESIKQKVRARQYTIARGYLHQLDMNVVPELPPIIPIQQGNDFRSTDTLETLLRLGVNRVRIQGRFYPMTTMEYLVTGMTDTLLRHLANRRLGLTNLHDIPTILNLFSYLVNSADPAFSNNLTPAELEYVSGLDTNVLLELLGDQYVNGSTDQAGLLYTIISSRIVMRRIYFPERYEEVTRYPRDRLWYLTTALFDPMIMSSNNAGHIIMPVPLYINISRFPKQPIETDILMVNETNVDELLRRYDVMIPPPFEPPLTQSQKLYIFLTGVKDWYSIRAARVGGRLPRPLRLLSAYRPDFTGINLRRARFGRYTTRELFNAYKVASWSSREELIELLLRIIQRGPVWRHLHTECKNDEAITVMGDRYGDVNKDDPNDPTISYGYPDYYRCYQISELLQFFRMDDDGIFRFYVPDFDPRVEEIDPITQRRRTREFTLYDINGLEATLRDMIRRQPIPVAIELLELIDRGRALRYAVPLTADLRASYNALTAEQQDKFKLFVAWIFLYGMWMRFWKGPGHPWPRRTTQPNLPTDIGWDEAERCTPIKRNLHITIQDNVRLELLRQFEQDLQVMARISRLPLIHYDFERRTGLAVNEAFINYLNALIRGQRCMGAGGDILTGMGYYLATQVLRVPDFDQFLNEMLPRLLDVELRVGTEQLAAIQDPTETEEIQNYVQVLTERHNALLGPTPPLERFNPTNIYPNIHI